MEYDGEPWVRRLRDGVIPGRRALAVVLPVVVAVGIALTVLGLLHPHVVGELLRSRSGFLAVLVPPGLIVTGPVVALMTLVRGRSDRRVLGRLRGGARPAFHIPVRTRTEVAADDLPPPRPVIWTVDADGLHGWAPRSSTPVLDLPWEDIDRIDAATVWYRGTRREYGIWIGAGDGHVVLAPRAELGRPFAASQYRIDVVMRILRSLRRQFRPPT
ncbi:hypothetical protein [Curtobacterium sp. RRHDQ10]|uniref:hypothetical protein n=1 Tax=Curtobacterium phyllosphaerae TaxID=3413379 RepID=UPI003BF285B8